MSEKSIIFATANKNKTDLPDCKEHKNNKRNENLQTH